MTVFMFIKDVRTMKMLRANRLSSFDGIYKARYLELTLKDSELKCNIKYI